MQLFPLLTLSHCIYTPAFRGSVLELDRMAEALGSNPEVNLGKGQELARTLHWRESGGDKRGAK